TSPAQMSTSPSGTAMRSCRSCRRCRRFSSPHAIAEALQLRGDARGVIALNLDFVVFRRPARAALFLQRRGELRERLCAELEAAGHRYRLPSAALPINGHANGLLRRLDGDLRPDRAFFAEAPGFFGIA